MTNPVLIENEAHWHKLRSKHVGASEVAALFNESPYMTHKMLWHYKAGTIPAPDIDHDRVFWGQQLETAIAEGLAKKHGWEISKPDVYFQNKNCPGMGATLDFIIHDPERGPGCLEIKNVDWLRFRDHWQEHAPLHIELQLQHQMACAGLNWGVIGALVGGNEDHIFPREMNHQTASILEREVANFWKSVAEKKEPPVEFGADLSIVHQIYTDPEIATGYAQGDEFDECCAEYLKAHNRLKDQEEIKQLYSARIIEIVKGAEVFIGHEYKATYKINGKGTRVLKVSQKGA